METSVTMSLANKPPSVVYWLGENLYLNITNECSNNCYFCFRKYKNGIRGFNLRLDREPAPEEVSRILQQFINQKRWLEVVFCGFGEPLTRLDCVLRVTKQIKKHFGSTVRIVTNGQAYLLNKGRKVTEDLKEAGVDRISVSLNAHDKQTYDLVCKPEFEHAFDGVLEFIEKAALQFDTEITTVTIPEVDIPKIEELARKMKVKFRLRDYEPCFW